MRNLLSGSLMASGLLLSALAVPSFAQYNDPYYRGNDPYNRGNDPYYRGNDPYSRGRGGDRVSALVDKVQYDLQRAASGWGWGRGGERNRLLRAQERLNNFRSRWNSGHYDRKELDRAIGDIQSAVDHNGVNFRERGVLMDDLARLREFRSMASNNGYRGGNYDPYGYRR